MVSPPSVGLLIRSQRGEQVLIIDAGSGTIDISTHAVLDDRPLRVEELYEPKCELDQLSWYVFHPMVFVSGLLQGGEFVTARAIATVRGTF